MLGTKNCPMNTLINSVEPDVVITDILALYETYGKEDYDGEPVSQASHMIQCAMLGMAEAADEEIILGAFLHDIGHMLGHQQQASSMGNFGAIDHEGIGAAYLRQAGFSKRICAVVENHVNAKRYLVATDKMYSAKLSDASWQTLHWQGGPMNVEEADAFKNHPYFNDIIRVRLWDEQAKDAAAKTLELTYFSNLIQQHLANTQNEDNVSSI